MLFRIFLLLPSLLVYFGSYAQLTQEQRYEINQLFEDWIAPNHPGGAIGIMQDGELIFSEAYGLASLEYLVPNTTETLFNIASVSKQFTAMGIVMLEQQGKLSLTDPITKHLPDLPEFANKITIAHMLHHTSGLRSLHAMLGMAGWRGDDTRTNEDLYRFVKLQKALNFEPGDEYLYCNTGFILAGLIIEKITQQDLPSWSKENIFEPLGMIHTYLEDKPNRVVKQNATSYDYNNGVFDRAVEYWGYTGSGNIHSTTRDLLLWAKNFYSPKAGWEKAFERMQLTENFNSGVLNTYALGVNVNEYKGNKRIQHGGSIGGFRSNLCTFPEEKLSVVILSNSSKYSVGYLINTMADLLLPSVQEPNKLQTTDMPPKNILQNYVGSFWDEKHKNWLHIRLEKDSVIYLNVDRRQDILIPIGENKFMAIGNSNEIYIFKSKDTLELIVGSGVTHTYSRYERIKSEDIEHSEYLGEYYSPELQTSYYLEEQDGELIAYHSRHGALSLSPIKKDTFRGSYPLGVVELERGKRNKITGFRATNGRVRNLWFEKK